MESITRHGSAQTATIITGDYDISTEQQARLDMFERAAERMRQILPEQYSQSEAESENSDEDECEM